MLKKLLFIFLFLPLLFASEYSNAQINVKDSMISASFFALNYSYTVPGGDMADRFGNSSLIGMSYFRKTKKNFVFGADFSYLFGNNVHEDYVLDGLATKNGNQIIDKDGHYSEVFTYERGFHFTAKFGAVIPLFGPNKNSGLLITAGPGFLQHKIRIETAGNNTPQLNEDYRKGYDRLTNGFALTEFVGYLHLSNKRRINYYAGFEFIQAFTQSRRDYNFDTMSKDAKQRLDLLNGIKIGFIIPVYRRAPKEFYYN